MIAEMEAIVDVVPLEDKKTQRFGNKAFSTYVSRVSEKIERCMDDLQEFLTDIENKRDAKLELHNYLLGSLGSPQRLDYGTGHELSFIGFLSACEDIHLWDKDEENAIVLVIFSKYLELVRKIQIRYNLEPAGSHGRWGLDDYQFLPFLFGSSQLIGMEHLAKTEDVVDIDMVHKYNSEYMYFSAIKYIHGRKTGPFFRHSSLLYNMSGIDTWEKINEGLIKMYKKEVLGMFPVVQHFPFGRFFRMQRRDSVNYDGESSTKLH